MKDIKQTKRSHRNIMVIIIILVVAGLLYTAHRLDLIGLAKRLHGG